jgi:hypothetical protein
MLGRRPNVTDHGMLAPRLIFTQQPLDQLAHLIDLKGLGADVDTRYLFQICRSLLQFPHIRSAQDDWQIEEVGVRLGTAVRQSACRIPPERGPKVLSDFGFQQTYVRHQPCHLPAHRGSCAVRWCQLDPRTTLTE